MGSVREEIIRYLKGNKYCVLCTCSKDDPRATPVRYAADDLKIIMYSEQFTKKFNYLKKNPNVALALHNTAAPIRGLQLWGTAEVITHRDPRHSAYLFPEAKRSPKLQEACTVLNLILITPRRIVMLDQSPQKGYRYLVWEKSKSGREKEREVKTIRELSKL
ncbi:MAG: pyridoxamine 5'-phosphate oxidase family protein [Proteobacteria bacterium]|nr:pyridoxamine 5'-phosphate oxidase family protein [Pseudomonadota bacterium]